MFQILRRYRFRRQNIDEIVGMLQVRLRRATVRSQALSAQEQVLLALRFYATGSMQIVVGDAGGVSQPSVSRAVTAVTDGLVALAPHHIRMPTSDVEILEVCVPNKLHVSWVDICINCIATTDWTDNIFPLSMSICFYKPYIRYYIYACKC